MPRTGKWLILDEVTEFFVTGVEDGEFTFSEKKAAAKRYDNSEAGRVAIRDLDPNGNRYYNLILVPDYTTEGE